MTQKELTQLLEEKSQPLVAQGKSVEQAMALLNDATMDASRNHSMEEVFLNQDDGWAKKTDEAHAQSFGLEFYTLQEAASALQKKNKKLESKLAVLLSLFMNEALNFVGMDHDLAVFLFWHEANGFQNVVLLRDLNSK